jgi:hypothetical protein
MATSTSYRLDPALKARLAAQATTEGVPETALVTRLLEQGLSTIRHPGVVFRPGRRVAGRPRRRPGVDSRAALRSGGATGDAVATTADLGIDARLVRIAVDYAEHLEIEAAA